MLHPSLISLLHILFEILKVKILTQLLGLWRLLSLICGYFPVQNQHLQVIFSNSSLLWHCQSLKLWSHLLCLKWFFLPSWVHLLALQLHNQLLNDLPFFLLTFVKEPVLMTWPMIFLNQWFHANGSNPWVISLPLIALFISLKPQLNPAMIFTMSYL